MANKNETTTKFKVDISELKKNISDAQRQIRLANAEFKAAAAGMDNWRTSTDGLSAKIGQLKNVLTSQKTILETLKKEYEQVAAEQGENSKGAQELAIRIKNQEAAVNKTEKSPNDYEKELKDVEKAEQMAAKNGKTVEENLKDLGGQAEKTGEEVKKSSDGFTVMKGALANLAAQGISLAINAMKDLTKATWEGIKASAAFADEINTMSKQTGLSTEALQEYKYMEDLIDVSTETMTGSMAKLIRNMASAQNGSKNTAAAFEALGVSITDSNGELRNNQDVFGEVIDALGKMENETQRDAYAMQIFGKSAQDLNPLIEAGGDKIAALAQEAHDMGYVLEQDTLDSLNETQDAFDRFSKTLDGTKNQLVAAFGPAVTGLIQPLVGVLTEIPEAVKTGDFSGILGSVNGIFEDALKLAEEKGPEFVKSGLSIVRQVAVGILEEAPQMLSASAGIIEATIEGLTEEAPKLIEAAPPVLKQLAESLIKAAPGLISAGNKLIVTLAQSLLKAAPVLLSYLPGLIQMMVSGLLELAPELLQSGIGLLLALVDGFVQAMPMLLDLLPVLIDQAGLLLEQGLPLIISAAVTLFNGIIEALPEITQLLIRELPGLITAATNLLVKSLPLILDAATQMLMGVIDALPIIIRMMVADLPALITAITTTLVANLPLILTAGLELLTGLLDAIVQTVPELIKKAPELVTAVVDGILDSMDSMVSAGKDMISGLWDGISQSKDWIKGKLTGWVGDVGSFLKGLFGVGDGGAGALNSALNSAAAAVNIGETKQHAASGVLNTSAGGGYTGTVVNNTYNTFNQTNNSPKALNRLEIYRQTKNQFSFATGG